MDYELDQVKLKLKVHNLKVERKQLRRRVKQYVVLVELMQDSLDEADRTITSLNALAESNKIAIDSLKEEIKRLNATIDRTVNAWESRCIEKYDEIAKLNGWVDELIHLGEGAIIGYGTSPWNALVARIRQERSHE